MQKSSPTVGYISTDSESDRYGEPFILEPDQYFRSRSSVRHSQNGKRPGTNPMRSSSSGILPWHPGSIGFGNENDFGDVFDEGQLYTNESLGSEFDGTKTSEVAPCIL